MTIEPISNEITPEVFRDLMIVMVTFCAPALIIARIRDRAMDRLLARLHAGEIYQAEAIVWWMIYFSLGVVGLAAAFAAMLFVAVRLLV